jgi:DNA adenine methylase
MFKTPTDDTIERANDTHMMRKPFLKWPGGKRWAAKKIATIIDKWLHHEGTYFEPFVGSGAVFFALQPKHAVLSDINGELINTYKTVRDYPAQIISGLRRLSVNKTTYYKIRDSRPRTAVTRAIKFLYLNRTAFAGMYRLNREGKFNVPFNGGDRDTSFLYNTSILHVASSSLRNVGIQTADFEIAMRQASVGDVIYCDPTYTVAHSNNGFVRYNENNFSWLDQQRLLNAAKQAINRGATVIISNAFHLSIHRLYANWERITLKRVSTICPDSNYRKDVKESLFILTVVR